MFRRVLSIIAAIAMVVSIAVPARAQVAGNGTLAGRAYFDLTTGLSDANEKEMTFEFRRIYFTYNMQMSDNIKGRFRTDVKQDADGKVRLYIKHAYADWKAADVFSLRAGVQGTILYGDIEDVWGYRHIEKTLNDLYKVRSSADFGLSATFSLSDMISVKAMFSNGEGYDKTDDGYGKAYEVQGIITPIDGLLVTAHYGMNGFDPDVDTDDDEETLMILGLDFSPGGGLNIIPNFYQTKSGTDDAVNTFRVTFYWKW